MTNDPTKRWGASDLVRIRCADCESLVCECGSERFVVLPTHEPCDACRLVRCECFTTQERP